MSCLLTDVAAECRARLSTNDQTVLLVMRAGVVCGEELLAALSVYTQRLQA